MKVIEEKLKSRTAVGDIRQYVRSHFFLEPLRYSFRPASNPSSNTRHWISVDRGSVLEQQTEKFLTDVQREHIWTVVICTHLSSFWGYPTGNLLLILIYLNIVFRQIFVVNLDSSMERLKIRHLWPRIELQPWHIWHHINVTLPNLDQGQHESRMRQYPQSSSLAANGHRFRFKDSGAHSVGCDCSAPGEAPSKQCSVDGCNTRREDVLTECR